MVAVGAISSLFVACLILDTRCRRTVCLEINQVEESWTCVVPKHWPMVPIQGYLQYTVDSSGAKGL